MALREEKFKLSKLLFVPNLSCNLVSVAKITKELNCTVTFFDDSCILQDRISKKPIGVGRQRDGVYFYDEAPLKIQSHAVKTSDLWRKRMGHPSNEVMSLFAKELDFPDYVRSKNKMCDACYRAKQTRMQFHVSDNNANDLFEVVHL